MKRKKRKSVKKDDREKEVFFVHIDDTEKLRRDILEALKSLLTFSEGYGNIKLIRHQKMEESGKLRSLIKEISKDLSEMKQKFPQTNIKLPSLKSSSKSSPKPEVVKRVPSELDKLSSELKAVESKLSRLG